jgi:uncharacterized membrane protein (UPF0182 family)
MVIAYRTRTGLRPPAVGGMEGYRQSVEPIRRGSWSARPASSGTLAGLSATSAWTQWMMFRNGGSFGTTDPQFGLDVGFFVFKLPFLRYLTGFRLHDVVPHAAAS